MVTIKLVVGYLNSIPLPVLFLLYCGRLGYVQNYFFMILIILAVSQMKVKSKEIDKVI